MKHPRRSQGDAHERELDSIKNVRDRGTSKESPDRPRPPEAPRPPPLEAPRPRPSPERESLENVVSEESEKDEPSQALEERIARSTDPEDLAKMRRLAEKVYHQGWNKLDTDEQLAFIYHSRFLEYLSTKERERADVQSTMYRMLGAQAKSIGLETRYTTRELSVVADRFFTQVKTPHNAPELYRKPQNTDYFKADRGT